MAIGLSRLFSRRRRYDDLSVSIGEHIAERTDELVGEGLPRSDAEQRARREFGNVSLIEQRSREAWQWPALESILADVRFAFRQLINSPGFTITAVVTLALGIAVNATMFSMVSAFLMAHLPGQNPQEIVVVSTVDPNGQYQPDTAPASAATYMEWRQHSDLFSSMAAFNPFCTASLAGQGREPEAVECAAVTANYFSLFGVAPALGRTFVAGENQPGHDHVIILSHGLWERRFGSDPAMVGKSVRLNREDYVVAGVMPADFQLLGFSPMLWTPLALTAADSAPGARNTRNLFLFARLAPGVTLERARAQMTVLAEKARQAYPDSEQRWGAQVRALGDFLVYSFGIRKALALIMIVVGFVLLIACANVAGLLLTRAVGRQKELAVRMSLGASRARVVRQLMTEGLLIALLGGGVGLLLTWAGIRLLRAGMSFNEVIAAVPIRLDGHVLAFAAAISLVSAVLSSVAPALKASRTAIATDLKNDTRGGTATREHNRLRVVLVGGEIAMALFLLIGTCLLIRAVYLLDHQRLGFHHDHLLTAGMVLDTARYADGAKQNEFVRSLTGDLLQVPGVKGVAFASDLPSTGPGSVTIHIEGRQETRGIDQRTALDTVATSDYFDVAEIPILRGRALSESDNSSSRRVVVVSQEFARKYFANEDPLGRQVQLDLPGAPPADCTVVGVVADVKRYSEDPDPRIQPQVYESYLQRPVTGFSVMLRSSVEPGSLAGAVRQAVGRLDPELPLQRVLSMDGVIDAQRTGNPLFTRMLATFAALALILAAIAIYGLIAFSVGQRSHEFGIRLALGAKPSDISRMVLRDGLKVAAIGCAVGFALALPLPKFFGSIFQGLTINSLWVYPLVLLVMLLVTALATLGPARRATRVDPTAALRNE